MSQAGSEIRQFCRHCDFELLSWPEQGAYGPGVPAQIKAVCSQLNDLAGVDCVISENLSTAPVVYQLRKLGYSGPVIMIPHVNPFPVRNLLHTLLWSKIWGKNDVVLAGSTVTAQRYESLFDMRSEAIPTYGVDETTFFPREKAESRKQFGLSRGPILLYTGRFTRDKNIGALLATYRSIQDAVPDAQLVMAVTFREQAYWDALRTQMAGVKVLEWVAADRLAELYSAADLFVSCATSYFETFGRSPAEARACGTPSVVPDWDGFRACVGDDGRLVPVDFLSTPLYEQWSYAMVNLPQMVSACLAVLSNGSSTAPRIPHQLTVSATERRIQELLQELTVNAEMWSGETDLQPENSVIKEVIDVLGASNLERILALSTCSSAEIPTIGPALRRELYHTFFD